MIAETEAEKSVGPVMFKPTKKKMSGIWGEIGVPDRGEALYTAVRVGFSGSTYVILANKFDLDVKNFAAKLSMSESTVTRRLHAGRFNPVESDKLARAAEVLTSAIDLFEGDIMAASRWMKTPAKGLGNKAPVDMLGTNVEIEAVLNLIGRLEHGVFA